MKNFVIFGNIIYVNTCGSLELNEKAFLVCENGEISGVFRTLPERYAGLELYDYGQNLVIPGLNDLHLHASQFPNLGLGLDMELLEWLDTLTFPTEAGYAELEFAQCRYLAFVEAIKRSATTRACIFATLHTPATIKLMELMEESGLISCVGKVNMDRNCPEILCETSATASLDSTMNWLAAIEGRFSRTKPIITPRFVPTCSAELMTGLGEIAAKFSLPIQSHLCENLSEISWVAQLHPDCSSYAGVYECFKLMNSKTIMAHCVHLNEAEVDIMLSAGSYIAHCPTSNSNLRSGIAPIRKFLDAGLNIGLGTDIAGGHTLDMFDVMRETISVSKLYWRHCDESKEALSATEAFDLATRRGGSLFGMVGSFENGYAADILVVDDRRFFGTNLSLIDRFNRMIYLANSGDVRAKFVAGERVF